MFFGTSTARSPRNTSKASRKRPRPGREQGSPNDLLREPRGEPEALSETKATLPQASKAT
jgi:hypothetical protein